MWKCQHDISRYRRLMIFKWGMWVLFWLEEPGLSFGGRGIRPINDNTWNPDMSSRRSCHKSGMLFQKLVQKANLWLLTWHFLAWSKIYKHSCFNWSLLTNTDFLRPKILYLPPLWTISNLSVKYQFFSKMSHLKRLG